MIFSNIPFKRVNWVTSSFLIGTLILALTAVPAYLYYFGIDWFQIGLFFLMACCTGFSITLGYHRLFSHLAFQAKWPIRLFVLIFGAAAFENSVLTWASEHRAHHKHVDDDADPYCIKKGFWYAHIGWLLFKLDTDEPLSSVSDLQRDPLIRWQHKYVQWIAFFVSFVLTSFLGYLWNGWSGALGGFLLGGVARIVAVQHCTFFINSACHTLGKQPYSSRCSARDSWLLALVTFGEGYHNYHHEFQHDYRNGVKPWQFDPTKWSIWLLSKVGLISKLRRVPSEKILVAQILERQRAVGERLNGTEASLPGVTRATLESAMARLNELAEKWSRNQEEYIKQTQISSREVMRELRRDWKLAAAQFRLLDRAQAAL